MRRRLFDSYHRHIAPRTGLLPAGLRGAVAGGLHRVTRHPDFAFAAARAAGRADDPLFHVTATPDGPVPPAAPGEVLVQVGYLGLRVSGHLRAAPGAARPDRVTVTLDGTVLRAERLTWRGDTARFRTMIARPVLDLFPPDAVLRAEIGDGRRLAARGAGDGWRLRVPHGRGGIAAEIARRGPLEKKGNLRPDAGELARRQEAYLGLYSELRAVFAEAFDRPLLVLYGTLLGQVRAGDFIPGDDDFDVGYPSAAADPEAVRDEAIGIMERLAGMGYTLVLNDAGRPFRVRARDGAAWCHLDNRPVFAPGTGTVWLHRHAALPLPLSDFETPGRGLLRGTEVLTPADPEAFLAAYYGPGWRVPDPSYTRTDADIPAAARAGLARLCLSDREQRALAARHPGRIVPVRWQPPYPLADYAARVGF
ncbi:LicD family protein [Jannaschia marina]|uniref:LicD family protein n=1 Tax=Jannaschia marina TaxID=2741674 RepID=UPI0015CE7C4A|nr:LicD family protein [Jannaschia marina]